MFEIKCCYKCEKRAFPCHSTCEEYKAEKERINELKKIVYDSRNKQAIYDRYHINRVERLKKNKKG